MTPANYCSHCGDQLDAGSKFCGKCGCAVDSTPVASPVYQELPHSQSAASRSAPDYPVISSITSQFDRPLSDPKTPRFGRRSKIVMSALGFVLFIFAILLATSTLKKTAGTVQPPPSNTTSSSASTAQSEAGSTATTAFQGEAQGSQLSQEQMQTRKDACDEGVRQFSDALPELEWVRTSVALAMLEAAYVGSNQPFPHNLEGLNTELTAIGHHRRWLSATGEGDDTVKAIAASEAHAYGAESARGAQDRAVQLVLIFNQKYGPQLTQLNVTCSYTATP